MALSGSVTTTAESSSSVGRSVTLNWSATQDVANNRSTISWSLVGSGGGSEYYWVEVGEIRVTINGSQVYYRDSSTHTKCYIGTVLCSGTTTIDHNSDGSKSFGITVEAGIFQYAINCTGSGSFTLDTIPRASTATLSASSAYFGGTITLYTNRVSSAFTHSIYYNMGGSSYSLIATGITDSCTWTIPASLIVWIPNSTGHSISMACETYSGGTLIGTSYVEFNAVIPTSTPSISSTSIAMGNAATLYTNSVYSGLTHTFTYSFGSASGTIASSVTSSTSWTVPLALANQIPSATSGVGTIYCSTYNGSVLIGTKSIQFTATVPSSVVPSISSITCSDPTGYLSTFGAYVQGKSTLKVVVSASGSYSSTIASYKVVANGTTYTSSTSTTGALTTSGTNTISVTVTDSRGRTASGSASITVLAYSSPTISTFTVVRCTSDGTTSESGAYMKAVFKVTITALNNKNKNTVALTYKQSSATTWTSAASYTSYSVDTSEIISASTDSSYNVLITATDSFTSVSKQVDLGTVFTLMDFLADGKGIAIGKVAETTNLLDCNLPAKFGSTLTVSGATTLSSTLKVSNLITQVSNGVTLTMGAQNSSFIHFTSSSPAFYFNTSTCFNGNVYPYTANARYLGTSSNYWKGVYSAYYGGAGVTSSVTSGSTALLTSGGAYTAIHANTSKALWTGTTSSWNAISFTLNDNLYNYAYFVVSCSYGSDTFKFVCPINSIDITYTASRPQQWIAYTIGVIWYHIYVYSYTTSTKVLSIQAIESDSNGNAPITIKAIYGIK